MIIVRYTVKPGQADANAELIRDVFAALPEAGPALRYEVFRDGDTFTHVAHGDGLQELPAFQAFLAGHADRCLEPSVLTPVERLGSYDGASSLSTSIS